LQRCSKLLSKPQNKGWKSKIYENFSIIFS
jgi:hypothetical protein